MNVLSDVIPTTDYTTVRKKIWQAFDPLNFYLPDDIHMIMRLSLYFVMTNDIVNGIITKMAEYPITEIVYDTPETELKERYEEILEQMGIKEKLIEYGINYNTYGNIFISILPPFKIIFINETDEEEILTPKYVKEKGGQEVPNWEITNNKLYILSPKYKRKCPVTIKQIIIQNSDDFKLIFWNPLNIKIEYNEFTDEKVFYYKIDRKEKTKIKNEVEFLKHTPKWMLEAILNDYQYLKLDKNNVLHVKHPSVTSYFGGWGLPPLQPVMNQIIYLNILRRAQAAIAEDHILTKRYLAPPTELVLGTQGPAGVLGTINLAQWKNKMSEALAKWDRNPNSIQTFPYPVIEGKIGGDGRALMLFQETDAIISEIIAGLGVPREFLFGGLSWSGSSVSLRMLENHFLNYRSGLTKIFKFLVKKISKISGLPPIDLKMRDFKMADDSIRKDLLINLANASKISDRTLLNEFGIKYENEIETLKEETKQKAEIESNNARYQMLQQALTQMQAQNLLADAQTPEIENQELGEMANYIMKGQFDKIPDTLLNQLTGQYANLAMKNVIMNDPLLRQLLGISQQVSKDNSNNDNTGNMEQEQEEKPKESNASGQVHRRKMNEVKPSRAETSPM